MPFCTRSRRARRRSLWLLGAATLPLAACGVFSADEQGSPDVAADVSAVAGWTRAATSASYLIVVNVLPAEEMYTAAQADAQRPTEGELIVRGHGGPTGADVRHVEAHVYSRKTGLALTSVSPEITVTNLTTGEVVEVQSTSMQDIVLGAADRHFGNNVFVLGGSDLRIAVTIGNEEVTVDEFLD